MTNDEYELMCSIDKAERDNENEKRRLTQHQYEKKKLRCFWMSQ